MSIKDAHVWNRLGWLAIILAHGFQLYVAYLLFFPVYPFKLLGEPTIVAATIAKQAGAIAYRMNYCQSIDVPSTISREFVQVDASGLKWIGQLPTTSGNLDLGCHDVTVSLDIPDSLPNGEYVLQVTRSFALNPLRTYTSKFRTQPFMVNR